MNTQTLTTEVVFHRSFVLDGLDGTQAPGTYRVGTYSELLDVPSAVAYRRLSTSIELHNQPAGTVRTATIDPANLEEALRLDAELPVTVMASRPGITPPDVSSSSLIGPLPEPRSDSVHGLHLARGVSSGHRWRQWLSNNANELAWIALVFGGLFILNLAP